MSKQILKVGNVLKDSSISDRVENQIKRGKYIKDLMDKSFMNRHQIAKIAGLANSHVKGLEDGVIVNPKRSSIVHLGVALNLGLKEIDSLLEFFGQSELTNEDDHLFVEVAERRELTKTLQPLYGQNISLDLLLISMEKIKGDLLVFNDKLPLSLRPRGYTSCLYGLEDNAVYSHIIEHIQEKRMQYLKENIKENKFNHFTTKQLLIKYIQKSSIEKYRKFLIDHILTFIDFLDYDNFNFNIIKGCPLFRFAIKYRLSSENKLSGKLFFVGHAPDEDGGYSEYKGKWLRGYATDDDNLVQQFYQEYRKFEIDTKLCEKEKVKEFIIKLVCEEGNVSRKELDKKLVERRALRGRS